MKDTPGLRIAQREVMASDLAELPDELHPVLRRVYAARRVSADELDPSLRRLLPVGHFAAAQKAAHLLAEAREQRIVVLGDFDADGATAAALCMHCLKQMGFVDVHVVVPDRFRFGYGLSPQIARHIAERRPDWLITVDNGIASIDGVRVANELGMQVLITDHHLPGRELPAAACIVNPNLADEPFAGKSLAGVGVAFYLMAALGRELAARGTLAAERANAIVAATTDLVALGTVADMVPLDFNNRVLVAEGLRRIRAGRTRPGIAALFDVAGRDARRASTADLGFAIAPRLNAAGRLTDMRLGIQCLLADQLPAAAAHARALDELNGERRKLQARMEHEARALVDRMRLDGADSELAYCLYDQAWHEGVVGLVASRIKERTRRPVFAFAPAGQAGWLKGSARSVDGVHVRDLIDAVATRHPGLVARFGGHAMAAGLSIEADKLDAFRAAVADELDKRREELSTPGVLWTDGALTPGESGLDLAETLAAGGPWGQRFPEPTFSNEVEVVSTRLVGERHLKLGVRYPGDTRVLDAIAFNRQSLPDARSDDRVRIVYRLEVNEFRDKRRPQLVVQHMYSD